MLLLLVISYCCGLVACKLNLCKHLWSEAGISLISAPAVQAMWCMMHRLRQSLIYMYNLASYMLGTVTPMVNFKRLYPYASNLYGK